MSPRYLVGAALIALALSPVSAQSVKTGIEAWQRADYAGAVAIWRPLAEKGDADAQFNLGQAYRLGLSTSARQRAGSNAPPLAGTSTPRRRSACCCFRTATIPRD